MAAIMLFYGGGTELKEVLFVFWMSLAFAVPSFCVAVFIGYPVYGLLLRRLSRYPVTSIFVGYLIASLCTMIVATFLAPVFGFVRWTEAAALFQFVLQYSIPLALMSAMVYWLYSLLRIKEHL